jgi:hypothetical protein
MAETSKFAGALAKLRKPQEVVAASPGQETPVTAAAEPPARAERGRGRPPGKRSNPDYEPTTVLLRKKTKRMAARKLEDSGRKSDLSELIQQLLDQWTANS